MGVSWELPGIKKQRFKPKNYVRKKIYLIFLAQIVGPPWNSGHEFLELFSMKISRVKRRFTDISAVYF